MNTPYPIAKLYRAILIVNKEDVPFIGKERAHEVMRIKVDFRREDIHSIAKLSEYLKFNPWEEIIDDEERSALLQEMQSMFSSEEISEKIVKPLAAHMIEHVPKKCSFNSNRKTHATTSVSLFELVWREFPAQRELKLEYMKNLEKEGYIWNN